MLSRLLRPFTIAAAAVAAVFPAPAAWMPQEATVEQAPAAKQKLERPEHAFIWKIEKEGLKPSYLFGTMHVPDKRFIKFNDTVKKAFKEADAVYTEVDMREMTSPATVEKIQEIGFFSEGTLGDMIPAETQAKLKKIVSEHYGMPYELLGIDRMRPFMASMTLEQLAIAKHYGPGGKALDQQIWDAAVKAGKEVGGVETLDEQFEALSVLTDKEAAGELVDQVDRILKDFETNRVRIAELAEHYLAGNEKQILDYVMEEFDPENPIDVKSMKALLDVRNVKMADRSAKLMKENPKKSYVFAFGALHMVGQKDVVNMLRDRGFQVTRLTAPPKKAAAAKLAPAGR